MLNEYRREKDILGELKVPKEAYWGINTQRAINNFRISGIKFPEIFIKTLASVKKASVLANLKLDLIDKDIAKAIVQSTDEIIKDNKFLDQFPIDIFQTGSGTQTNMNMNEVLANRANEILGHPMGKKSPIHPNDHINMGQSSNDVIPTAMHISIFKSLKEKLIPALLSLDRALLNKIKEFASIIKVGRTHLQDAVPIPLSLEFDVYRNQIKKNSEKIDNILISLRKIPIGGTAVGTGLNAHKDFAELVCSNLQDIIGFHFQPNENKAEFISSHQLLVEVSGILRLVALSVLKMANDIRWMGSGPRAGLCELIIPPNEPGSSIMPGKVNPTQCEMLIQVSLQVMGNDAIISLAESHGSILDLNVCKPIMIYNILESIKILSNGISSFIEKCLKELKANIGNIQAQLGRMLMIVTNLNPIIGYDKASEVARKAFKENITIKEAIIALNIDIPFEELDNLLDPKKMV